MGLTKSESLDKAAFFRAYDFAFKKNSWRTAIPIWKTLADRGYIRSAFFVGVGFDFGYVNAQWNLSLCYQDGDGIARSPRWSKYWLKKAAGNGHKKAKEKYAALNAKI